MARSARTITQDAPGAAPQAAALRPSLEGTWLVACGAVASGLSAWEGIHALRLIAVWLVADTTLRFVFRQLTALKAAASIRSQPGDHAGHLGLSGAWRRTGPHAWNVLLGAALALTLATYVGRQPLVVAAVTLLAAGVLALLSYHDAARCRRWLHGLSVSAAWLMGHAALGPLNGLSVGLALLAGVAAYARTVAPDHGREAWWVLRWAWTLLIVASIQARQPVVTAVLAIAALGEAMSREIGDPTTAGPLNSARRRANWLVSLAVTALASTYWG